MRKLFMLFSLLVLLACTAEERETSCLDVTATDAWIREAPPGAAVMAGYGEFSHAGSRPLSLLSASSTAFSSIEFHETIMTAGQMKMQKMEQLQVPSAGTLTLAPSGKHMMLFNPTSALKAGDRVQIRFDCEGGENFNVDFEVRKFQINDAHGHHGHH